jgi:hypothetical protein
MRLVLAVATCLALAGAVALQPAVAQSPPPQAPAAKAAPAAPQKAPAARLATRKAAPAKKAVAAKAPKLGPNQKQCRSKLPDGSIKTWTCGKDQPCCVSHTFGLYTCGSQLLKCF